jgi:hypothetical protein
VIEIGGRNGFIDRLIGADTIFGAKVEFNRSKLRPFAFKVDSSNILEILEVVSKFSDESYLPVVIDKNNLDAFYLGITIGNLTTRTILEIFDQGFFPVHTLKGHEAILQNFSSEILSPAGGGIKIKSREPSLKVEYYGYSRSVNKSNEDILEIRNTIELIFGGILKRALAKKNDY